MTRPLDSDKGGGAWWRAPGVIRVLVSFNVEWAGLICNTLTLGYLMHERSDSAFALALQVAAYLIPYLLVSIPGGLAGDMLGHRRALMILFALEFCLTVTLFGLELGSGEIAPWTAVVASFALGTLAAAQQPSYFALLGRLVPDTDLPSAIAVSSSCASIATAIGLVVTGVMIATVGVEWIFPVAAMLTVQVLALLAIGLPIREEQAPTPGISGAVIGRRLAELRALLGASREIRSAILVTVVFSALALPLMWLVPVIGTWAEGGPGGLGGMWGALYLGAAVVAPVVWLARRRHARPSYVIGGAGVALGLVFIALAVVGESVDGVSRVVVVLAAFGLYGLGLWLVSSLLTAEVQRLAPPGLEARAVAVFEVAFDGVQPVAVLAWGALLDTVGVSTTLIGAGALMIVAVALLVVSRRLGPLHGGTPRRLAGARGPIGHMARHR